MLETSARILGQEHPSTLTSMASLASTYRKHGRREEAQELDVRLLQLRSDLLSERHLDTT